jgi:peptidoglycan hydrolase CwlO-like protein
LAEKKEFYTCIKTDQEGQLVFIEDFKNKINIVIQDMLDSSTSSTYKTRGLNNIKSIRQEIKETESKLETLNKRIQEIQEKIKEFKELLKE